MGAEGLRASPERGPPRLYFASTRTHDSLRLTWRFLCTPPMAGAANMALDEALLARARQTGEGVVRVYSWAMPTITFGRNQTVRGAWDAERARARGFDIVRRLTGGRALLHHREITYSVTAPVDPGRDLRADYAAINQLLLATLRTLGVDAAVAPRGQRLPPPGGAPCFELPAAGELIVGTRKLVGSAQVREGDAFLQHGSVLVHDDQHRLRDISSRELPITPAAALAPLLGRDVTPFEFADLLRDSLRERWDPGVSDLSVVELESAMTSLAARYEDDDWTWRR